MLKGINLFSIGKLSFYRPDEEAFPLLSLAKKAILMGGAMGAVLNAADEIAVDAFLKEKISFFRIPKIVEAVFDSLSSRRDETSLEGIIAADKEARIKAQELI